MNKELYRTEDEYGPIIVLEQGDKRTLSFGSDLQQTSLLMHKPQYLVHEYTQIMLLGLVFTDIRQITILGLGGGGLAHCLNYYYPQIVTRVVEIRQSVIDIAYQWFNLPQKANLKVYNRDAREYIKRVKAQSIDLLLSDLYEAQGMNELQAQTEFIEQSNKALSDSGWMVINFHQMPDKNSAVMKTIYQNFSDVRVCDVFIGNWILFCGKKESAFDKNEINERVRKLAKKLGLPLMYYFKNLRKI
ncbi:MAG: hypothetical protein DIZ80_05840 [endosymbiont of Galathealinum brachiosum]|uniref:Spermidine synthase n=1 Tax=endosymbiont of Galathealinum brachiosum TaxID=2200906 RepID=A0A370DKS3_9GAMM|nr:MAG: hypothetical protein DIZ80_05840 [endosymbiont of Galathealinum brachiosum]